MTKVAAIVAAFNAVVGLALAFGVGLDAEQAAALNVAFNAVIVAVVGWFDPNLPLYGNVADEGAPAERTDLSGP